APWTRTTVGLGACRAGAATADGAGAEEAGETADTVRTATARAAGMATRLWNQRFPGCGTDGVPGMAESFSW
ncbi:hypothetical protein ACN6K9_005904, partial [Streptomyces sp. SAS_267]|uniref:hypothetical protein n=1 Tax=Streptomyces sp. SAS_267 TaxID=3412750 RepID=UPI00403C03E0